MPGRFAAGLSLCAVGETVTVNALISGFMRVERVTTRIALVLAVTLLALAATLAFYQVITRFVFNAPSMWSEVASRSLIIWAVFLGAAAAFRSDEMMRVEIIYSLLPPRWHWLLETLIAALCLTFFVVLAWYSAQMGYRVRNQTVAGLDVSIAWAYSALPVGSVFGIIAVIARYLQRVTDHEMPWTDRRGETQP